MIVGMVSTRFAGLDGVSLESAKVARALTDEFGFAWFAGMLGDEFTPGTQFPPAHFADPSNLELEAACFSQDGDASSLRATIQQRATAIEVELLRFMEEFSVDVLMPQNALAIPMQLPLGVALRNVIDETGVRAVAHHHDFAWERARFSHCAVPEILDSSFPPVLPSLRHVVINSEAAADLRERCGVEATVVPNVMDFAAEPPPADGSAYRVAAGLAENDVVLLQPTRIIERKGIELTLALAAELADPAVKVVVSHPEDRDPGYWGSLQERASDLGVDLRMTPADSLADAYAAADLVCFPSRYEGFGNALLEALYYRRPVFVNRYSVYVQDIAPTGVRCVEIDGAITANAAAAVAELLADEQATAAMVEHNYHVGLEHFSFNTLRARLGPLLSGYRPG